MSTKHTPGPWRWEINLQNKSIHLVGGRPMFDKTVMQFDRWGMFGATPMFNGEIAGDKYNVMHKVHERNDWIAPFPNREHHANWCAAVTHPDARLMAAAPALLAVLEALVSRADSDRLICGPALVNDARAAIANARGESA